MQTYRLKVRKDKDIIFNGFPAIINLQDGQGRRMKVAEVSAVLKAIRQHISILITRGMLPGLIWHEGVGGYIAKISDHFDVIPIYPGIRGRYPTSIEKSPVVNFSSDQFAGQVRDLMDLDLVAPGQAEESGHAALDVYADEVLNG